MGRHAAGPTAGDPSPQPPAQQPQEHHQRTPPILGLPVIPPAAATSSSQRATQPADRADPGGWLREALVLGLAVAAATGGVLLWALGTWWVALLGALGAAAVVTAATWVARSVPGPDSPSDRTPTVDQ